METPIYAAMFTKIPDIGVDQLLPAVLSKLSRWTTVGAATISTPILPPLNLSPAPKSVLHEIRTDYLGNDMLPRVLNLVLRVSLFLSYWQ